MYSPFAFFDSKFNHQLIRIIAVDEKQVVSRSRVLRPSQTTEMDEEDSKSPERTPTFRYKDTSMRPGLDPSKQFAEERQVALLSGEEKDNEFRVEDFETTQIEAFTSVYDAFKLLQTISDNGDLKRDWGFLHRKNEKI